MLRRLTATAAALVAAVVLSLQCYAVPSTSAGSLCLLDAATGEVLAEKNACQPSLIASTTKIMTALVVTERCDLDRLVTVPPEATGIEGSSMYLKTGEQLTVRELLYGLMLHSGNDAAVALALCSAGSVERFVGWMNETAQSLALCNTHFANPNGLDDDENYSTAHDLAILTRYALKNPEFLRIVSTRSIRAAGRCLTNHNRLLWSLEGAIGVKTGYTRAAGRILVSAAERCGRRLIVVTINDGNDWRDHSALYDYGFSLYQTRIALRRGDAVAELKLLDGSLAVLKAGEDFSCALKDGERVSVRIQYPRFAFRCGLPGTPAGVGSVWAGQTCLGTISLIWGECE